MASKIFLIGQFILDHVYILYTEEAIICPAFIGVHFLILLPLDVNLMGAGCSPMDGISVGFVIKRPGVSAPYKTI
jgi:hypothetical protein